MTTIRTHEDARRWIAEILPHMVDQIDGDSITIERVCRRCGGTGRYSSCAAYGTRCFECAVPGRPARWTETVDVKAYAQSIKRQANAKARNAAKAEKNRAAAVARREENERNWCEQHGHGRITFKELDAKRKAEREAKKGQAPAGVVTFTGKIIKKDWRPGFTRGSADVCKITVLVTEDDGTEWLAWGTAPASLLSLGVDRGAIVRLTASLEAGREPNFCFFKRPRNAELVEPAEVRS